MFIIVVDKTAMVIFIIDYLLQWITADYMYEKKSISSFLKYPFSPMAIIGLLSILPSMYIISKGFKALRILRMIRAFRVFRVLKTFHIYSVYYDEVDERYMISIYGEEISIPKSAAQYARQEYEVPAEVGENCESLIFYK